MTAERTAARDALVARARREIDEGLLPSCQIAVAHEGELVLFEALGDATTDHRSVVFSCTKGLVAGAVWQLLGEGRLGLDTRAADLIDEFATNGKETVTVEHLLTHTGGFPNAPLHPLHGATSEGRVAAFARWRAAWAPGTHFQYHPTAGHWVLAELIERVTGDDYRTYLHRELLDPLGLHGLRVGVPPVDQDDVLTLVATGEPPTTAEVEAVTGMPGLDLSGLVGEVSTTNLLTFNKPEVRAVGVPGAGAIDSAADLALYYQAVLHNPGERWKPDLLAEARNGVRCDLPDPFLPTTAHRSLGLQVAGDPPGAQLRGFGHGCSPRTFGHDGAGGQVAWVDPDSGTSFAYVTPGLDEHLFRAARRKIGVGSRAAAFAATLA